MVILMTASNLYFFRILTYGLELCVSIPNLAHCLQRIIQIGFFRQAVKENHIGHDSQFQDNDLELYTLYKEGLPKVNTAM